MSVPSAFLVQACSQLTEMIRQRWTGTVRLTLARVQSGRESVTLETDIHMSQGHVVGRPETNIYLKQSVLDGEPVKGVSSV